MLLSYVLFGFGILLLIISIIGIIGCRRSRIEFLRTYSISLASLILIQIVLLIILNTSVELIIIDYSVPLLVYLVIIVLFESMSVLGVYLQENELLRRKSNKYYFTNINRNENNPYASYQSTRNGN
jgi:hypothetical protein